MKRFANGFARAVNAALFGRGHAPDAAALVRLNLHEVVPGALWRCAQPAPRELERLIDRLGLATVFTLRGAGRVNDLAQREEALCRARGVGFHRARLHSNRAPSPGMLARVLRVVADAPRPLLVHCRKGVDRSGFVAALALLREGHPVDRALREFSRHHGYHARFGRRRVLPGIVRAYGDWLDAEGAAHAPERLARWVHDVYPRTTRWNTRYYLQRLAARHRERGGDGADAGSRAAIAALLDAHGTVAGALAAAPDAPTGAGVPDLDAFCERAGRKPNLDGGVVADALAELAREAWPPA